MLLDIEDVLVNYEQQIITLKRYNKKLYNLVKKKRHSRVFYENIYDYCSICKYNRELCDKLNMNICLSKMHLELKTYDQLIELLRQNYVYIKRYNSGRYSKTYVIKDKNTVEADIILIKKTKIKNHKQLLKSIREFVIQTYIHNILNVCPKTYFYYILSHNDAYYSIFGMKKIKYVFYRLFDIRKMNMCYNYNRINVLNELTKALKIYIGSLEKMILNGVIHNDPHDGNFCFDSNGSISFIDFAEAKFITKIDDIINNDTNTLKYNLLTPKMNYKYCTELKHELQYFIDMYYFNDDYDQSYNRLYSSKLYSPVRTVYNALTENKYKFGSHLNHVNDVINIDVVIKNRCCGLQFKLF